MSVLPQMQHNLDEIVRILTKTVWVASYEIFLQNNNWLEAAGYYHTKLKSYQREESGFSVRILTRNNQLLETTGSVSAIGDLKDLREPKSTYPKTRINEFKDLIQPRISSIPGDQANSTHLSIELIDEFFSDSAILSNPESLPVNLEIDILKETRVITNSTSSVLTDQALRVQMDLIAKFMIRSLNYSFVRSSSNRSLQVNLQPFLSELKDSVDIRAQLPLQEVDSEIPIILHPEVIGRLIIYHVSRVLQNPESTSIRNWNPLLQFYDDPLLTGGHYSTLFDDQGQLCRDRIIISDGSLTQNSSTPQRYRVAWFQPTARSYRYPLSKNVTNLVIVGGTGKGKYFTDRPGNTIYIKRGYGISGIGSIDSKFVIHANEVEIWKNGSVIGHHDNLTIYGDLDEILSKGQMSSDRYQVVDRAFPGSVTLGWFVVPSGVVQIR